jgi:hypothetical protein
MKKAPILMLAMWVSLISTLWAHLTFYSHFVSGRVLSLNHAITMHNKIIGSTLESNPNLWKEGYD